jgi:integrase
MATIPLTIPAKSKSRDSRPKKPYPGFPLFANQNGQWCRKVQKKPYYFGTWADDLKGERALQDWNVRQAGIMAGSDNLRVAPLKDGMALGELMGRFLKAMRAAMLADDLAKPTYGDYLRELPVFVEAVGEDAVVAALTPDHFSVYADKLIKRKLGRHARKRVISYIKAMLNWGATNGQFPTPTFGTAFVVPDTSPDAMRQAKARAGLPDFSERIVTGPEIDKLVDAATPLFKGIILLSVNCGLGPADIGRMKWSNINMETGEMDYPRWKTGVPRRSYLWKRTREALERVATLKHNAAAIHKDGADALIFLTRKGLPMYRETEIVKGGKSLGVKCEQAMSITFGRLARTLKLRGVTLYRLRHTFETLGDYAEDDKALAHMMGHKLKGSKKIYNHRRITLGRMKKVALVIKHKLWGSKTRAAKGRSLKAGEMRMAS